MGRSLSTTNAVDLIHTRKARTSLFSVDIKFQLLRRFTARLNFFISVRHPRPVRESSCPTWSFLPVAWFLPDWRFPFLRLRLRSSSPWPPFILSLGRDVSGSAEPALVLYALGTEHLPRCSHSTKGSSSTSWRSLLECMRDTSPTTHHVNCL